ncbi:MAG: hypothetical protein M3Q60_08885 [Actinomycetota bacterium]|nr:hypothetical protein [Actinomycetota bacterium]
MRAKTTRAQRTTAWGLAALGASAAVASVFFGLYSRFPWFDEALHVYNFFALTLLVAVYAYGVVLTGGRRHGFLLVMAIAAIGLALGAAWEIAEFGYDHFVAKPNVILPKIDTIVDMILDTLGALVAGLVCLRMLRS